MFSGVVSCSDTKTAVCLLPEAAERAVSALKAVVQLCVLVSEHERTPLNIRWVSSFETNFFPQMVEVLEMPLSLCCFQLAVTSAMSLHSQDCTILHDNAVEHYI